MNHHPLKGLKEINLCMFTNRSFYTRRLATGENRERKGNHDGRIGAIHDSGKRTIITK